MSRVAFSHSTDRRRRPLRLVASGGQVFAPVTIAVLYLTAGTSVGAGVASLAVLVGLSAIYFSQRETDRGLVMALAVGALTPTVAGWPLATPALGAALFVVAAVIHRPWRALFSFSFSPAALACSSAAVLGVAIFQIASSTVSVGSASYSWIQLPGQDLGPGIVAALVIVAAAFNATFEELMWRIGIPCLFRTRRWRIAQWIVVSVCFGLTHIHGTPGGSVGMVFTAVFGFAMHVIRHFSRNSMWWIVMVHFAADVILIGALYVSQI